MPARMLQVKNLRIATSGALSKTKEASIGGWANGCFFFKAEQEETSNAHRHDDVAIAEIVLRVFRANLTRGLSVFEFQPHLADISDSL
jgi:hypothetical protein